MTTKVLPLYNDAVYSYDTDLGDEAYTLTFRWNSRLELYTMDIEDAEENYLIRGVPLVPVNFLLSQYVVEGLEGDFILVPIEESSGLSPIPDPRYTADTHFLVYTTDVS